MGSPKKGVFGFGGQNQVQWAKLSWNDTPYVKFVPKLADSNEISDFPKYSGKFQKWWKFVIPHQKPSSLTKIELEKHPIHWKICYTNFFLKIYQTTTLFGKVAILLRKSSSPKRQFPCLDFFSLKFFLDQARKFKTF